MKNSTKGAILLVMAMFLLASPSSLMAEATTRYISPCVLNPNEAGCPGAAAIIGCTPPPSTPVPANPYHRGCLTINRCRPGNGADAGDHA
ncbi:unnamed protein product [Linum trigynum]|uniref:Uncharacterized protein n=1 Tax=Linum trigynum TaxID=586398 RepID=A0AAV2D4C4_9ROSI